VSTPRRKAHLHAIRTRKFGHFDRAHEESRMHLGDQVMTTSEEDASIKPRSSYSSQNNQQEDRFAGNRNSRARSARGGSARGGMNVSRGVKVRFDAITGFQYSNSPSSYSLPTILPTFLPALIATIHECSSHPPVHAIFQVSAFCNHSVEVFHLHRPLLAHFSFSATFWSSRNPEVPRRCRETPYASPPYEEDGN